MRPRSSIADKQSENEEKTGDFFRVRNKMKMMKKQNEKHPNSDSVSHSVFVRTTGFEPAHLMAPPPQDGMSTNFTTCAYCKRTADKYSDLIKM